MLDASKLGKKSQNINVICSYLAKIGITVETFEARPKNTNPFGHPRENKTMLAVGKGPPAPFSESRHWDWLSGEGQPANRGSFLRSCGWRRQSSEVLYVTYQHGLPFNQRVERKDKVKPSSLGTENQTDFTAKPCKGRHESETHNRFAIKQIAPSEKKKEVEGLKWSEGMSQSDLGKMVVEWFSNLRLKNMRGT